MSILVAIIFKRAIDEAMENGVHLPSYLLCANSGANGTRAETSDIKSVVVTSS